MPQTAHHIDSICNAHVYVISEDMAMREQMHQWSLTIGVRARSFASPRDFIDDYDGDAGCLVLDLRSNGCAGLAVVQSLKQRGMHLPALIAITRHDDVDAAVAAMKCGAVEVLHQPIIPHVLTDCLRENMQSNEVMRKECEMMNKARRAIHTLTPREREVLSHLLLGSANKEIAVDLGMNSKTASTHRANILQKMGATNIVDLVRMMNAIQQPA